MNQPTEPEFLDDVGLKKPDRSGWRTGLEGIWQEGKNYRITQQGLFLSRTLASGMTLEINAGQAKAQNYSASAYIGLTFASTY